MPELVNERLDSMAHIFAAVQAEHLIGRKAVDGGDEKLGGGKGIFGGHCAGNFRI
jgi:hypothetical protein